MDLAIDIENFTVFMTKLVFTVQNFGFYHGHRKRVESKHSMLFYLNVDMLSSLHKINIGKNTKKSDKPHAESCVCVCVMKMK